MLSVRDGEWRSYRDEEQDAQIFTPIGIGPCIRHEGVEGPGLTDQLFVC